MSERDEEGEIAATGWRRGQHIRMQSGRGKDDQRKTKTHRADDFREALN